MGLSTNKQVSEDHHGIDWSQTSLQAGPLEISKPPIIRRQQQQKTEPLKCPRCSSANTKFCYYNNYNKSQPRHLCKACKRHWTEGGTLRNVPVGGGRKNKRLKAAKTSVSSTPITSIRNDAQVNSQSPQNHFNLYQALISPSSSLQNGAIDKGFAENNGNFIGSNLVVSMEESTKFSVSSLGSFETLLSSVPTSNQSFNGCEYMGKIDNVESSTITTVIPISSSTISQPWQGLSNAMDMQNYWSWNDIDTFVSADLNVPWEDMEIKP